jgi:hypothetical protein
MSNDVYHSGYLALVSVTSSCFQVKGRGFQDIAENQTELQRLLDNATNWDFQRYFWAGPGPGVCILKGTNLKETIQTCG